MTTAAKTIAFNVLNRWTDSIQFTAQIECAEDTPLRIKIGLALKWGCLRGADLLAVDLRGALKGVPVVPHIDAAILAAIEAGGELDMSDWHTCETTHCRAGWAIHLAGPAGAALEFAMGPSGAGAMIYAASRPGKPIPDFHTTNEKTLADLQAGAMEDPLPATA